jgi:hypothetical protein
MTALPETGNAVMIYGYLTMSANHGNVVIFFTVSPTFTM